MDDGPIRTHPSVDPSTLLPTDDPVQLLAPDGTYTPSEAWPLGLDDDQLRELYRLMVVARRVDREAINLQRQGQLGVYASCRGQEAAQVGSAYALEERDWVFPSYRETGAAVARGVDAASLLHLYRGTWLSDHDPHDRNFGLLAIPIGTQALHATGFAMGAAKDGTDLVTLVYFGDGGTSEGDPHEAMTFAGAFKAPVVFFVQNNQWAISVPLEKQTAAPTLAHKGVGYGIPGMLVDGNDVLATHAVARRAVERARAGEGPSLVEALTYRMEAHTTSDDPTRYRTAEDLEAAAEGDPILRMRRFLEREGLHDQGVEDAIEADVEREARRMREELYEAPHGDPQELFAHVYVDPTGHFADQSAQLARELQDADVDSAGPHVDATGEDA